MVSDLHSHILPEMDDGSASVEESIAMLRMEAEQGVTCVVATPHFYPRYDDPAHFLEKRARSELLLRQEMKKHCGLPTLLVGAEVYFFRGMSESDFLPQLTIGGKDCMLIEMPPAPWPEDFYRELEAIWVKRGILPIVAHIDRYIAPWKTFRIPEKLAQLPVFVQANAEFFLSRSTAAMACRMLKAGQIQLLGSDCHDQEARKPNLGAAVKYIERKVGSGVLSEICECERRILGI